MDRSRGTVRAALLLLVLVAACSRPDGDGSPPRPPADVALATLEERLLEAGELRLRYRVRSEGTFPADLRGDLTLTGADEVQATATGTFGDAPVELGLETAGGRLRGGSAQQVFDEPVPPELRDALVLGLTRMGILHNLSRLVAGRPPDHAEGGVREWVRATDVTWIEADADEEGARQGLRFGIEVSGQAVAEADLWLDADGLPVRRTQVVRFPGGEMSVTEEYEFHAP